MLGNLKRLVFTVAKYTGCFAISRYCYRKEVRVLCYHGFTLDNESNFLPKLFIDPEIFCERMRHLKEASYNLITLDQATKGLQAGTLPDNAVVLTIDDGFYGVFSKAAPILKGYGFPATLYLTSYYFDRNSPIFSLAVKYMFWATTEKEADLTTLDIPGLAYNDDHSSCAELIIEHGQSRKSNEERIQLLRTLGALLRVDYDELNNSRKMGLINSEELRKLLLMDVDIQMHTHRHNFPLDLEAANYEIEKNREKVEPLLSAPMRHFCYPSGLWSETQRSLLESQGIESATTCLTGLMSSNISLYSIPRFLDGANISQIEYESELAGFSEFCRKFKFWNKIRTIQG
jgi:peptidoglycan/xylan/chitin deacetylase (PgdA/CDA1 family)